MTRIKLCGLTRPCDIEAANALKPEYIGFIFASKSRRYISMEQAAVLKKQLIPTIETVGVFVNEAPERVAACLNGGLIDIAQLHGSESAAYIRQLKSLTGRPLIQAFRIDAGQDIETANFSVADYILLDSGTGGTGTAFDWRLLRKIDRPYFLAGGLTPDNVEYAIRTLAPYAVDVSSGIETDGCKDQNKMAAFVTAARAAPGTRL
ncbi:MAG: phosphoribosylanthranilate isomerase [Blautia sp.]|nr:phosphoribosylanthranilate isomerase [Blautia sp.]MCM1199886.1 phosphoribosylanthranilate isomerase [Bacteroides fragilis]